MVSLKISHVALPTIWIPGLKIFGCPMWRGLLYFFTGDSGPWVSQLWRGQRRLSGGSRWRHLSSADARILGRRQSNPHKRRWQWLGKRLKLSLWNLDHTATFRPGVNFANFRSWVLLWSLFYWMPNFSVSKSFLNVNHQLPTFKKSTPLETGKLWLTLYRDGRLFKGGELADFKSTTS